MNLEICMKRCYDPFTPCADSGAMLSFFFLGFVLVLVLALL
jgi:hypothetical protein